MLLLKGRLPAQAAAAAVLLIAVALAPSTVHGADSSPISNLMPRAVLPHGRVAQRSFSIIYTGSIVSNFSFDLHASVPLSLVDADSDAPSDQALSLSIAGTKGTVQVADAEPYDVVITASISLGNGEERVQEYIFWGSNPRGLLYGYIQTFGLSSTPEVVYLYDSLGLRKAYSLRNHSTSSLTPGAVTTARQKFNGTWPISGSALPCPTLTAPRAELGGGCVGKAGDFEWIVFNQQGGPRGGDAYGGGVGGRDAHGDGAWLQLDVVLGDGDMTCLGALFLNPGRALLDKSAVHVGCYPARLYDGRIEDDDAEARLEASDAIGWLLSNATVILPDWWQRQPSGNITNLDGT